MASPHTSSHQVQCRAHGGQVAVSDLFDSNRTKELGRGIVADHNMAQMKTRMELADTVDVGGTEGCIYNATNETTDLVMRVCLTCYSVSVYSSHMFGNDSSSCLTLRLRITPTLRHSTERISKELMNGKARYGQCDTKLSRVNEG